MHKPAIRLRRGISLVELLIVIFIIAILLQLLLPAVQSAREAARKTQCQNNLYQLALGAQLHLDAHGFLPSGGWAGSFTADPNRGYGRNQPGGWAYSILEYIEQGALRQAGKGESMTSATLGSGLKQLHESAPELFYCPSRRIAQAYPPVNSGSSEWGLVVAKGAQDLPRVTKLDYAANSGDSLHHAAKSFGGTMWSPESYEALESKPQEWTDTNDPESEYYQTGVSYYRSEVKPSQIPDGLAKTYLFGEKYMDPATYEDIREVPDYARLGDNQSAWAGFEWDNHRVSWQPDATKDEKCYQPQSDAGAVCPAIWAFGSAHAGSLNMAYCDGSVRTINYDIDRDVHRYQANRLDSEVH
jgi:prepilin-type processing-associated H-X9-DG protein